MIQGGDPTGTGRGYVTPLSFHYGSIFKCIACQMLIWLFIGSCSYERVTMMLTFDSAFPKSGESIYGGKMEDEITRNLKFTGAGIVAMANSGTPNSNGSQFFITLKPTPWLDNKHTILGRIYRGMGVVQRMGLVATQPDDQERPLHPITIHKASAFIGPPSIPTAGGGDGDEDQNKVSYDDDDDRRPIASRYF